MSFNATDITLHNYEEAFVLYIDNELSPQARLAVETFALLHPHLAEELELLMATKLPADDITFSGKEALLSATMQQAALQDALLLYIDNELHGADLQQLQATLLTDEKAKAEHALLLATKADASERIVCPDKESLYRRERRVVPLPVWLRMAAAVILLLGGSLYFFTATKPANMTNPVVINNQPPVSPTAKQVQPSTHLSIPNTEQPVTQTVLQPLLQTTRQVAKQSPVKKSGHPLLPDAFIPADKHPTHQPLNTSDVAFRNYRPADKVTPLLANRTAIEPLSPALNPFNKTVSTAPVTTTSAVAYNPSNTLLPPAVSDEDVHPPRQGSVKGFLRKTTRFIQRNTGIGTVNVDDEILVGALTVRLK